MFFLHYEQINDDDDGGGGGALLCGFNVAIKMLTHKLLFVCPCSQTNSIKTAKYHTVYYHNDALNVTKYY